MSIYETKSFPRYKVDCLNGACEFHTFCNTPGAAEIAAKEHIQEWTEEDGFVNQSHVVEITESRIVKWE